MPDEASPGWLFLTDHGAVLLSVAADPTIDSKELAHLVGVGEREVKNILDELVAEGYIVRTRPGRNTRYDVNRKGHLRHPLFEDVEIGPLIDALQEQKKDRVAQNRGFAGLRHLPGLTAITTGSTTRPTTSRASAPSKRSLLSGEDARVGGELIDPWA